MPCKTDFVYSYGLVNCISAKPRDSLSSWPQCILSTSSPSTSMGTTTVLDLEKLRLPSLDANSDSVTANRPWTYTGAIGPPSKVRILFGILITEFRFIIHQYDTFFSEAI